MAFMEIKTIHGEWYKVEVRGETHYVPPGMVSLPITEGATWEEDTIPEESEAYAKVRAEWQADVPIPSDVRRSVWADMVSELRDYVDSPRCTPDDVSEITSWVGWGARYSAPGYMDCTDWVLGETEEEAISECKELYGDEEDEDAEEDDEPADEEEGPAEDDLTTKDHRHFWQDGKLVFTVPEGTTEGEMWEAIDAHMKADNFYPDVFFISDHGNTHLMVRPMNA